MDTAIQIALQTNPNALIGKEDNHIIIIEDIDDTDNRIYRIEYQSNSEGTKAIAYCLSNPHGGTNGGVDYPTGHVDSDGLLCLGGDSSRTVETSNYSLDFVMKRAKYWCIAFSVLKQTGEFPDL